MASLGRLTGSGEKGFHSSIWSGKNWLSSGYQRNDGITAVATAEVLINTGVKACFESEKEARKGYQNDAEPRGGWKEERGYLRDE